MATGCEIWWKSARRTDRPGVPRISSRNPARRLYIEQTMEASKLSVSTTPNAIPFLDLVAPHVELEQELTEVFRTALRTAGFIGGPMVEEFEQAFAGFCGTSHSVAVSSGTDALRFAIMACGVQPGDVVVTVPHTFIATTEAISQAGALPEFVDIDELTYNMSVRRTAEVPGTRVFAQCIRKAHQQSEWTAGNCGGAGPSLRTNG